VGIQGLSDEFEGRGCVVEYYTCDTYLHGAMLSPPKPPTPKHTAFLAHSPQSITRPVLHMHVLPCCCKLHCLYHRPGPFWRGGGGAVCNSREAVQGQQDMSA
jgi:hypothetical protein